MRPRTMLLRAAVSITVVLAYQGYLGAPPAFAAPFTEGGDAGPLFPTAQAVVGSGPLDSISGTISSQGDVDLYRICLTGGGTFSATTVGTPGTLGDTQLFLFDANGLGVEANDDAAGPTARSTLPAGGLSPAAPGVYYLAITAFPNYPVNSGGGIFPNVGAVVGPTGPGGGQPLSGWTGGGDIGTYTIALTGAVFCPAQAAEPEPITQDQTSNQTSAGTQSASCTPTTDAPCDQDQTATQNTNRSQIAACSSPTAACDQNQTANQNQQLTQNEQSGGSTTVDQDQTSTQNEQVSQSQYCSAKGCDQDQTFTQTEDDGVNDQVMIAG